MQIDTLCAAIQKTKCPVCVGLDTHYDYLPDADKNEKDTAKMAAQIYAFNCDIVDAIKDVAPSVKVQAAYYEMLGADGVKCFYDTMQYAHDAGLVVIADVKRNDIGSTAKAYSTAYLQRSAADFITVNAYFGIDGIQPFLDDCKDTGKGIFVLVKTSNPSGGEFQDIVVDKEGGSKERRGDYNGEIIGNSRKEPTARCGQKLYQTVADKVSYWGASLIGDSGYSSVGAVVGATYPEQAQELRTRMSNSFFLVPGYGAQGAGADDIAMGFDDRGLGAVVNSSRGILLAYKKEKYTGLSVAKAARQAVLDMKQDILGALTRRGIDL